MPSNIWTQAVTEALKRQPRLDRLIIQLLGSDQAHYLLSAEEELERLQEPTD